MLPFTLFWRWQRKDSHDGGCEVPPVCPSLTLWEWPNNLLHSSGRGVWTHVLPHQHPCSSKLMPCYSIFATYSTCHVISVWQKPIVSPLQVKPLIWIESIIEKFSHSRVEIMVKVLSYYFSPHCQNNWKHFLLYFPFPFLSFACGNIFPKAFNFHFVFMSKQLHNVLSAELLSQHTMVFLSNLLGKGTI